MFLSREIDIKLCQNTKIHIYLYNFVKISCLVLSRMLSYLSKPFQLPVWYSVYVHHCYTLYAQNISVQVQYRTQTVYVHHCYSLYAQDISVQVQYCTQNSLCTPLLFSVCSRYISSGTVQYLIQFMYTIAILCMLKIYQFMFSTVHNTGYIHNYFSLYV